MTQAIDWSGCDLVEVIPGKVSGQPLLKDTRLPAQVIVENYDDGLTVAEISEQFEVEEDKVRAILKFAESQDCKPKRQRAHTP